MSVLALLFDVSRRLSMPATAPMRRWASWPLEQLSYHRAYFTIRRLSPHMIADMGMDPDDLPASFRKKWHTSGSAEIGAAAQADTTSEAAARRMVDKTAAVMAERADACACP